MKVYYEVEYQPGNSKMWHKAYDGRFTTEKQAMEDIKQRKTVNSLGNKLIYRVVKVTEIKEVREVIED